MPGVDTADALLRAVDAFEIDTYELPVEAAAMDRAARSLAASGLLLLGEVHGVLENPLVVLRLVRELGVGGLALEWPEELAPQLDAFLADGSGLGHPLWWSGAGNITAGHFAVLRALERVTVTLFDGCSFAADWSARDAAMADRVLTRCDGPTLVVAGNLHTRTEPLELGVPMGARLAEARPGVESVAIDYGSGGFYNFESRRGSGGPVEPGLRIVGGQLVVGLPEFREAIVPHVPPERVRVE
ncbi:MAG: hypothetical protein HOY71_53400 [Nonomuraea sp.]|nr:hypothetical protein [Nonomuraea sp.]